MWQIYVIGHLLSCRPKSLISSTQPQPSVESFNKTRTRPLGDQIAETVNHLKGRMYSEVACEPEELNFGIKKRTIYVCRGDRRRSCDCPRRPCFKTIAPPTESLTACAGKKNRGANEADLDFPLSLSLSPSLPLSVWKSLDRSVANESDGLIAF